MAIEIHPARRIWNLLHEEKKEITSIYFYSILNGLIQLSLPIGIQAIIGFILAGSLSTSIVVLVCLIVLGVILVGWLQMSQMKVIEKIQQKIFVKNAFEFTDRLPRLDLQKADSFYLPELVNRFFETVSLQKSISKILLDFPTAMIQILFGLILLSFYHPVFIFFGLLLILLLVLILYFSGNQGMVTSLEESSYKYSLVGWMQEVARLVKSFKFAGGSVLHLQKADERTQRYLQSRTKHFVILLLQYRTLIAFKVIITAAMLIVGVALLLNQQMNIGQFVAAEIIIITTINSVEKIIINLDSVYDVLTAIQKLGKLTDKPVENTGSLVLGETEKISISTRQLTFGYGEKPVLKDLSIDIAAGQKIAVTGSEGSGKSTLLKMLTGAYPGFDGSISINGIPLGNYDLRSYREALGIFFLQENIFNGTLWENITMGKEVDREYLQKLVALLQLESFLQSLPSGYDTPLDPTGKKLSSRVVQKILFARAVVGKPRLLLMEEPWQGMEDPVRRAMQAFIQELRDTTVVVATNDADFIKQSNQVIQL